ncbi:hypothetical protein MNBD_GAMMA26-1682 [hydrothermal vent metagenome]|uniref:Uncharacterized protein n=1 Tax=hydrothermal vent metagenome TaxID=652676 RepID=A0A3B1AW73_9ZZZZ
MKPLVGAAPLLLLTLVMPVLGAAPVIRSTTPQAQSQPQQRVLSVDDRLQLVERRMQTLTDVLIRLDRIQQEIQQLQGSMELQGHALETLKQRQRDLYGDIDRRMRQMTLNQSSTSAPDTPAAPGLLPGQVAGVSGQPSVNVPVGAVEIPVTERPQLTSSVGMAAPIVAGDPQVVQVAPPTTTPAAVIPSQQVPGTTASAPAPVVPPADPAMEQPMYEQAFDLLMQRRYEEAKQAFRVFLTQYPNSRLAANSQYWVGEASYVTRDFTSAMADFNKVLQIYPASPKIPDTLLKIAFIQYERKDWVTSRKTLEGVVKKYPTSTAARLARKRLERMRIEGN